MGQAWARCIVPRWLQSGLRRDICVIVASVDEPTETSLKTALEAHYGERVRPGQFHGAVDALVRQGHLDRRPDGLQDRLLLTEDARAALTAHAQWLIESLDGVEGGKDTA